MKIWSHHSETKWSWFCSCGQASRDLLVSKEAAGRQGKEHVSRGVCKGEIDVRNTDEPGAMREWARRTIG